LENPNEKAKKRLAEIYDGCSPDEQNELTSMGIHPEVALKLKELLAFKKLRR
jgi:hypothetical protein